MAQENMYLRNLRQDEVDANGRVIRKGQISQEINGKWGDYCAVSIPWDKERNGVKEAPTGWIQFNVKVNDAREGIYMSRDFENGTAEEPEYLDGYKDVKLNPTKSYPCKIDTGKTTDLLDELGNPVLNDKGERKQRHIYKTVNIPGAVIYKEYRTRIEKYKAEQNFDQAPAKQATVREAPKPEELSDFGLDEAEMDQPFEIT